MDPNKVYLTYPDTDLSIFLSFLIDSSQHPKIKSLEKQEVQNKLNYHGNMYRKEELRKWQDPGKRWKFCTNNYIFLKVLEYFKSS